MVKKRKERKTPKIQNRFARFPDDGSILSCLGPTIVQASRSFTIFSLQVQVCRLRYTLYNVHNEKWHAGDLLRAIRLEKCTTAIFSPQQNGVKNTE